MPAQNRVLEDLISIYHEILINEVAVMRANTIIEEGYNTGKAIIYYNPLYPLYTVQPDTGRGLDYLVLAYAILNGVRRLVCGYNILKPIEPEPSCGEDDRKEMKNKLLQIIKFMKEKRKERFDLSDSTSLEDILAELIFELVNYGLLYLFPDYSERGLYTIEAMDFLGNPSMQVVAREVDSPEFIYSLRAYSKLELFFEEFKVNPSNLLRSFHRKLFENEGLSILKGERIVFKTLHGVLYKYASLASSLPDHPATLESNILPFMIEPPPPIVREPSPERTLMSKDLLNNVAKCLESSVKELGKPLSEENIMEIRNVVEEFLAKVSEKFKGLSTYQYNYLIKMFAACGEGKNFITAITSPTGSGKTLIFVLYVLVKILVLKLLGEDIKAVIVYPRKALERDQLDKIISLVGIANDVLTERGKNISIVVGIRDGDSFSGRSSKPVKLRGLKLKELEICHQGPENEYTVFLGSDECKTRKQELDWLRDVKDDSYISQYNILITNHSTLYKLTNEALIVENPEYLRKIFGNIRVLVIDEAHIYSGSNLEVLATALLKLLYTRSQSIKREIPGSISELVKDLDIVVSSATLTDQYVIGDKNAEQYTGNIIGFFKFKPNCREENPVLPEPVEDFFKDLMSTKIFEEYRHNGRIIFIDYDCTISEDFKLASFKDSIVWKYPYRLKIALVVNPYPSRQSWTALNEVLVTTIHWINVVRESLKQLHDDYNKALGLVFIDAKVTLKDVFTTFIKRQILDAQDHADRVLLTGDFGESLLVNRQRIEAREKIINYIDHILSSMNQESPILNAFHLIYGEGKAGASLISEFTNLPLYVRLPDYPLLVRETIKGYNELLEKVVRKLSMYQVLKDSINEINVFAREYMHKNKYRDFLENIGGLNKTILMHHGDLEPRERAIIEACMKGEKTPVPLVVMSTSTLELGVDIGHIPLVVQFASEPSPQELNQRMGRSGRSFSSFYVSTLILVLRNTGEDLAYSRDQEAVEYVYNFKVPKTSSPFESPDILARHMSKLFLDTCMDRVSNCLIKNRLEIFMDKIVKPLTYQQGKTSLRDALEIFREWTNMIDLLDSKSIDLNSQTIEVRMKEFEKNWDDLWHKLSNSKKQLMWQKDELAAKKLEDIVKIFKTYPFKENELKGGRIMNPLNVLPYLRLLSSAMVKFEEISVQAEKVFKGMKDYIEGLFINMISFLTEYISQVYLLYEQYIKKSEVLYKKIYLYDTITPGMVNDIGIPYSNHILLKLDLDNKGNLKISEETRKSLEEARPLHIKLTE